MVMRRKRRRFPTIIVALIVVALSVFVVRQIAIHKGLFNNSKAAVNANKELTYNKNGSISIEENEFFTKYTITCKTDIKDINQSQDSKNIALKFSKNNVSNLGVNTKASSKGISAALSNDKYVITITKKFTDNNFVYIDSLNSKNVIVLVSKLKDPFKYKIVLDPGHGGVDKGANIGDLYEKDITLKIAKFMPEFLRYKGFNVVFTRETDKWVNVKEGIPNIANSANADLFVSIHINSFTDPKYSGVGVYYYIPNGYQKDERIKFATDILNEAIKSDGWKNRGIASQNLAVLKYTKIPCALIECGFITNEDDRKRLQDDNVLKRLASNIVNGVEKYIKETKQNTNSSTSTSTSTTQVPAH